MTNFNYTPFLGYDIVVNDEDSELSDRVIKIKQRPPMIFVTSHVYEVIKEKYGTPPQD